ncbi:MAG: aromatic amino acid transaminase [Saezia sp.]
MFTHIPESAGDPILSLVEKFDADPRPNKINLSIGLFYDGEGKIPLLDCVRIAEERLTAQNLPRPYLPMDGHPGFRKVAREYVFSPQHEAVRSERIATIQTIGGSGALSLTAHFLRHFLPKTQFWVSDPTWSNHLSIFRDAGIEVHEYPYYDLAENKVCFDKMLSCMQSLPEGSMVLLHPCCHNPTGMDLTQEQWKQLIPVFKARKLIAYMDIAYQGFGQDIETDAWAIRAFADAGIVSFVGSSFSKSFGLYAERVGVLHVACKDKEEAKRILGQLKSGVRLQYSSPPIHGAQLIDIIFNTPELRQSWEKDIVNMRTRVQEMRRLLKSTLTSMISGKNFDYLTTQQGLFSYTGLTKQQVDRLREEYAIYVVGTGRICVAGLNHHNVKYVAESMAKVMAE